MSKTSKLTDEKGLEKEDLAGFGFYTKKDPKVPESDYFLISYTSGGSQLWARKSEEGKKWTQFRGGQIIFEPEFSEKKTSQKKVTKKGKKK
jgi:hypothetical protein